MNLLICVIVGVLLLASGKSCSSGAMKQVAFNGRKYTIFSLPNSEYQMISNEDPNVWVTVSSTSGIVASDNNGKPAMLELLFSDMKQLFPTN